ncbi:MAG: FtsW/RodA/SpoVE family cell cycle protein [Mycobacteriales bacterium]|nr:FtsW/RodA/SpoVE family cell cycle protein [Frankia sp.]
MTAETIRAPRLPHRRNIELRLLLFAVAIAVAAYIAVGLAHDERIPAGALSYGLALALLFGVAHLAVRYLAPAADPLLLPLVALLNGVGVVVVRRLDFAAVDQVAGTAKKATAYAPLQLVWTAVGVALFVATLALVRDHRFLDRYRYSFAALGLVLLMLPAVPGIGRTINGAKLWLRLGVFSIQPSEFAKICLIVFFASYLVAKREVLSLATRRVAGLNLPRGRDLGPVVLAWLGSLAVLVFERDLGSSLLFFGIFIVMLYVATERTSWVLIGLGLFGIGTFAAYEAFGHVRERVDVWLHPFRDAAGHGYQLVQALFGFGTGGLTGTGLGRGRPDAVPFARTDFVFAALGEEIGLFGVVAILLVYAVVVMRGLRTALGVRDEFGKLLAGGLAFALALQVFVVVGGVTRLIPLTGITLPFLSYGGSSLVANYVLVALLLRVSDSGRSATPGPATPPRPTAEQTGEMTTVLSAGAR